LEQFVTVEIKNINDLQTNDLSRFESAMSELVKMAKDDIEMYKDEYHIVFNLSGGFKSVQGFMQTLAMFYADETIYLFLDQTTLMRIPKLPIKFADREYIEQNLTTFRKLSLGFKINVQTKLSKLYCFNIDNDFTLTSWGELIWSEYRSEFYSKELLSPVGKLVRFSKEFEKNVKDLENHRIKILNEKIDLLSKYLKLKGENLSTLDFKSLKGGDYKGSTHEFDAWHDQDAKRCFGHFEGKIFVIDRLDRGLH
jgi:hypothetical protein